MEEIIVKVDGKEYKVFVEETEEGKILVHCGNDVYEVETKKDAEPSAIEKLKSKQASSEGKNEITAPLPGVRMSPAAVRIACRSSRHIS